MKNQFVELQRSCIVRFLKGVLQGGTTIGQRVLHLEWGTYNDKLQHLPVQTTSVSAQKSRFLTSHPLHIPLQHLENNER